MKKTELYENREFRVLAVCDHSEAVSRVVLTYDVDLHCATILTYYPKSDTYDATFTHAFNRAWTVLGAAYSRTCVKDLWIDPMATARFLRGLADYLKAKRFLVRTADEIYKATLRHTLTTKSL